MLLYTIVIEANDDEDAASWVANKLDPECMQVRGICGSAFLGHRIVRVEADLASNDYVALAFEGSLNHEMNDPLSEVVWWNKNVYADNRAKQQREIGKTEREPRGRQ